MMDRRDFLGWAIGTVVAISGGIIAAMVARFLRPPILTETVRLARVPDARAMRVGDIRYVPEVRAYLIRGQDGFYALSAVCTHLGCLVHKENSGFRCPCHGSRFDARGVNLAGPAPRPLPRLSLRWEGDTLIISTTVDRR